MKTRMVALALMACALGAGSATAAAADTLVVDQAAGPYTTIGDALADAADGDTVDVHASVYPERLEVDGDAITIHGAPGTIVTSAEAPAVGLTGRGDKLAGLTVAGGVGVAGYSAEIADATLTADDAALLVVGSGQAYVHHTLIRALAPTGTAVVSRNDSLLNAQTARFENDVVLGGPSGTGFDVRTGQAGESGAQREATGVEITNTTVTGAPTALSTGTDGLGGPITVNATRSIVHGSAPGLVSTTTETAAADAADFVNPQALDFHLRADAPAAMFGPNRAATGIAGIQAGGGIDFGGTPRSAANTPAVGAYVFVDHAPTAAFTTSVAPGQVAQGRPVTFDASASADPDVAIGGSITKYVWSFGDWPRRDVTTTTPVTTHAYSSLGDLPVTLTTYDNNGLTTRVTVRVHVADLTPPAITFSRPRDRVKLHRFTTTGSGHHKHKSITVLRFSGKADQLGAGRPVMLTFRRTAPRVKATKKGRPAPCVYASSGGRMVVRDCAKTPPTFPVQTKRGSVWGWASAKHTAFGPGTWTLTATATDLSGNVGTSVLHFTVT
jgi:hypothetical protein